MSDRLGPPDPKPTLHHELPPHGPERENWSSDYLINLRLSLPLLFGRYYLTIAVGKERRSAERRAQERQKHPLVTAGNLAALGVLASILFLGTLALMRLAGLLLLEWSGVEH